MSNDRWSWTCSLVSITWLLVHQAMSNLSIRSFISVWNEVSKFRLLGRTMILFSSVSISIATKTISKFITGNSNLVDWIWIRNLIWIRSTWFKKIGHGFQLDHKCNPWFIYLISARWSMFKYFMKPGILGNKYRSLYVEISILMDFYTLITSKCMYMYLC